MSYFQALIDWIKEVHPSKDQLAKKKVLLCKEYKHKSIPTDIEIFLQAKEEDIQVIKPFLQTKPTRSASGVSVVATMSAPFPCPHGSCTYCPGGPDSSYGDTPKSYTGKEPSTMRGMRHDYDPYRIIFNRLEQYIVMGIHPDKVEQIIMGGTFPSFPKAYQEEFVYYSYKAYNDFSELFFENNELKLGFFKEFFELPGKVGDEGRAQKIKARVLRLKKKDSTLEEEQAKNQSATIRCIGLTIETKPDWGRLQHGLQMLKYGTTRVELGVQTVYDEVLQTIHRGHSLEETKESIAELRDLGFKLNFHLMPGLPGKDGKRLSKEKDLAALKEIFTNPDYMPDMLKIYPCMVMPGTALEKQYEKGIFKPITTEEAADLIVEMKAFVPEWCRIMRIQRDIPTFATTAGVASTNLRQIVQEKAKRLHIHCRCIRCREVGLQEVKEEPELVIREYNASDGKEFFISMEAEDKLLGFVRLRFPPRSLHPVITESSALIRELHVYGKTVAIGTEGKIESQHKGIGKKLMAAAEDIAKKHQKDKMVVISGVGVRGYYEKLGYMKDCSYMTRQLQNERFK